MKEWSVAGFTEPTGRINLREDAEALGAPTLIVHGRDDTTIPYSTRVEPYRCNGSVAPLHGGYCTNSGSPGRQVLSYQGSSGP
jgi:pimeloyl-ACP methyl ester carboxylesterase